MKKTINKTIINYFSSYQDSIGLNQFGKHLKNAPCHSASRKFSQKERKGKIKQPKTIKFEQYPGCQQYYRYYYQYQGVNIIMGD